MLRLAITYTQHTLGDITSTDRLRQHSDGLAEYALCLQDVHEIARKLRRNRSDAFNAKTVTEVAGVVHASAEVDKTLDTRSGLCHGSFNCQSHRLSRQMLRAKTWHNLSLLCGRTPYISTWLRDASVATIMNAIAGPGHVAPRNRLRSTVVTQYDARTSLMHAIPVRVACGSHAAACRR